MENSRLISTLETTWKCSKLLSKTIFQFCVIFLVPNLSYERYQINRSMVNHQYAEIPQNIFQSSYYFQKHFPIFLFRYSWSTNCWDLCSVAGNYHQEGWIHILHCCAIFFKYLFIFFIIWFLLQVQFGKQTSKNTAK